MCTLHEQRLALGLSQGKLSQATGVAVDVIRALEYSQLPAMRPPAKLREDLLALAHFFGLPPERLFPTPLVAAWRATYARQHIERVRDASEMEQERCRQRVAREAQWLDVRQPRRAYGIDPETVPDPEAESPEAEAVQTELRTTLAKILKSLPQHEVQVLIWHYGLSGAEPETPRRIAAHLGLSEQCVRQIEARAMSQLRLPANRRILHDFLCPQGAELRGKWVERCR